MEGLAVTGRLLLILAFPLVGSEPFDCRVVAHLRRGRKAVVFGVHCLEEVIGNHRPDGVERIVPREALLHEASHCTDHWLKALGDLIFDDGVERSVRCVVRNVLSRSAVVRLRKLDAVLLVKRKPLGRNRRNFRFVVLHERSM